MPDPVLALALALFAAAFVLSWFSRSRFSTVIFGLLILAVCASTWVIAHRWISVGYGPFLTLYEVLLSNVFSLGLILTIAYRALPDTGAGLRFALPVVLLIGIWALQSPAQPAKLPATFDSPWLWLHVGTGKVFLGMLLVTVGLALAGLAHRTGLTDGRVDEIVWRFASFAFVFDSAMLLTGAIWANHAWGRYWNWDPVETWALLTWLCLGLCLHIRRTWQIPLRYGWAMLTGVFILAFLTLFGMPFLSIGPHKGIL